MTGVNLDLGRLQINGLGGDDGVTVDVGDVDLIGVPITFDGGPGNDLLIVDGQYAAAIWDESATTIHGDPYENHGVDVFRVEAGEITVLHENNDVLVHRRAFGAD